MAWCHQASSHYFNQCWPSLMTTFIWHIHALLCHISFSTVIFGNIDVISCEQLCETEWISECLFTRQAASYLAIIPFDTPVFRRQVLWYGAVRPSVRPSVRPTVSTKKHRCKWQIFFKFCTQVCWGVPSINLLFVLSYLIKYAHNSIISDFSIFGIHRVIF